MARRTKPNHITAEQIRKRQERWERWQRIQKKQMRRLEKLFNLDAWKNK